MATSSSPVRPSRRTPSRRAPASNGAAAPVAAPVTDPAEQLAAEALDGAEARSQQDAVALERERVASGALALEVVAAVARAAELDRLSEALDQLAYTFTSTRPDRGASDADRLVRVYFLAAGLGRKLNANDQARARLELALELARRAQDVVCGGAVETDGQVMQ